MNILIDNTGLQNFGACLTKKCQDENAIDDFLQICIQMIFYDKLSVSILVPQYINSISERITSMINEYDNSIFNIENKKEQKLKINEILNEIAIDFDSRIDDILESCKKLSSEKNENSIPGINSEMQKIITYATKAIQTGDTNLIELLRKKASDKKNDSYFLDIMTRDINSGRNIMNKILEFNKKHNIWNNAMSFKIMSSIRISTNQILTEHFSCPYSPAVIRAKAIQQQRDLLFLKVEDILSRMNEIEFFSGDIKLPSFEDYLLTKGKGNPENILKLTIELRKIFLPVRDYIKRAEQKKQLNKVDYLAVLKSLEEIAQNTYNSLKVQSSSAVKKTIENVHIAPAGPWLLPIPDVGGIRKVFSKDLRKCRTAFTEITNDMIGYRNSNQYRKILIKNCLKQN